MNRPGKARDKVCDCGRWSSPCNTPRRGLGHLPKIWVGLWLWVVAPFESDAVTNVVQRPAARELHLLLAAACALWRERAGVANAADMRGGLGRGEAARQEVGLATVGHRGAVGVAHWQSRIGSRAVDESAHEAALGGRASTQQSKYTAGQVHSRASEQQGTYTAGHVNSRAPNPCMCLLQPWEGASRSAVHGTPRLVHRLRSSKSSLGSSCCQWRMRQWRAPPHTAWVPMYAPM